MGKNQVLGAGTCSRITWFAVPELIPRVRNLPPRGMTEWESGGWGIHCGTAEEYQA